MITRDDIKVGNKLKLLRDRGMNRVNDDVKKRRDNCNKKSFGKQ
jgi:hypothetical protein